MEDLKASLEQYNQQLSMVSGALTEAVNDSERESLTALQSELKELIQLTRESVDALTSKDTESKEKNNTKEDSGQSSNALEDEYALFMKEMADSGAYEKDNAKTSKEGSTDCNQENNDSDSDIEDELATLLGMKCAVYHTHKWGGQPTLHNAMVCAVVPRLDDDQFSDLQVRVLFTHPTHAEMLPCPFYLEGECKFDDEKCRYSHGTIVQLSDLKDAVDPNFEAIRAGSRVLLKLKPPDNEDISLTKKSTEKYHLWHRAVVKSIDLDKKICSVKLEHGIRTGEKRKSGMTSDELQVKLEELFPLNADGDSDSSDSDSSDSETEYPAHKTTRPEDDHQRELLIEKSLQNNAPAMGEWERHTRGIGSKLMLAMGYVPGTGLGAAGAGRVAPVAARLLPVGRSLDHCMAISERAQAQDPLKVEQKLRRMQKKEEERNKRAYEREKEKERRNVFNFLNKTLGDKADEDENTSSKIDVKQSTSKDLNINLFKIMEDTKKIERDINKLTSSLVRHAPGSAGHRNINLQIMERNKELSVLKNKEKEINKEQSNRKNKEKMTVF